MKLRIPFLSRARHEAEIDAAKRAHEADNKWLLDQLKQSAKRNIELEAKLAQREDKPGI